MALQCSKIGALFLATAELIDAQVGSQVHRLQPFRRRCLPAQLDKSRATLNTLPKNLEGIDLALSHRSRGSQRFEQQFCY